MRRSLIPVRIVTIVLLALFMLPLTAHAGGDYRVFNVDIFLYDAPAEAEYADLLISREALTNYTELNAANAKGIGFDTKALAEYDKDGFVSYSLHYDGVFTHNSVFDNVFADNKKVELGPVKDERNAEDILCESHCEDAFRALKDCWLKVVLLDKDGNIIRESDRFTIHEDSTQLFRALDYRCAENGVNADYYILSDMEKGGLPAITIFVAAALVMGFLIIVFKMNIHRMKSEKLTAAQSGDGDNDNKDNSERKEVAK